MVANAVMTDISTTLILLSFAVVPLAWIVPSTWALDAIAAWTVFALALLSPISAVWLVAAACLTPLALRLGDRTARRGLVAAATSAALFGAFAYAQLPGTGRWIGASFFTLRHVHVVAEWWMGRLPTPSLRNHLRYQLFLPVMVVGPIHRFENFTRQSQRRRWDIEDFLSGAERVLIGAFMAYTLGGWLAGDLVQGVEAAFGSSGGFLESWLASAVDWIKLYFVFAGLTGIALGISLMTGLRLEENFNQPWRSSSLLDFWSRWHMSLSSWVLDYVFRPTMALSRNPFLGLLAAMLAIGLWHEFSVYYVLWSFWQVMGVVLTRYCARYLPLAAIPKPVRQVFAPVFVLAWLSLARPVILKILELAA